MRHQGTAAVGLIAALAMVLGGCGFFKSAWETGQSNEMLQPQAVDQVYKTVDDLFAEVAQQVPTFGGMFFDENDNNILYLYLLNPTQKAMVERAIAAVFGPRLPGLIPPQEVRVLQGQYSFLQLKQWHDRMMALFTLPGVLMIDIDDNKNRLKVGVKSIDMRDIVEQELDKLGIPREAVTIEETRPVMPLSTLRDKVRPLVGALKTTGAVICTLGFNARRSGVEGSVTNSHCTNSDARVGGVDNAVFHQPEASGNNNRIGIEAVDPPLWTGGSCDSGYRCRWSDSAFIRYDTRVSFSRGFIARTANVNVPTDITIVGNWRIVYKTGAVVPGLLLNKVGQASGWSQGGVTSACATHRLAGNIALLCQHSVQAYATNGDSGSPVFMIRNQPSQYDVWLYGLLWGGGGIPFVFSDIEHIQGDLGILYLCASGFSC
jgi:hypothetical protein